MDSTTDYDGRKRDNITNVLRISILEQRMLMHGMGGRAVATTNPIERSNIMTELSSLSDDLRLKELRRDILLSSRDHKYDDPLMIELRQAMTESI